jgi:hypothetical protein
MVDYLVPHHYAMDSTKNLQQKMELFIAGRSFCAWSLATSLELISLLIFIFGIIYSQRIRSQRYTNDFVEPVLDNDPNFDSDDDIMGKAVYDKEHLKSRRQDLLKITKSSGWNNLPVMVMSKWVILWMLMKMRRSSNGPKDYQFATLKGTTWDLLMKSS